MELNKLLELIRRGENERIEFKRGLGSEAVKDLVAFLNTVGGTILFGLSDDKKIIGLKERNPKKLIEEKFIQAVNPPPKKFKLDEITINKKHIALLEVEADRKHIYTYKGAAYARIGSMSRSLAMEELVYKAAESLLTYFDSLPNFEVNLKEIDLEKVKKYLEKREEVRGVKTIKIGIPALLRIKAAKKHNGNIYPTNAGLLFFGKKPEEHFPTAVVRIEVPEDEFLEKIKEKYVLEGDLWKIVDGAMEIFRRQFPLKTEIIEGRRQERRVYPLLALREALINALVHKNYFVPADVRIFIFPNRVEIINPGSFPPGTSVEDPQHIPRNPILSQYFYDIGYIEKYGIGIKRIREWSRKYGLAEPIFKLAENYTKLIFQKKEGKGLSREQIGILEFLKTPKSALELALKLKTSKMTALRKLDPLLRGGFVRKEGSGKNIKYLAFI